VSLFKEQIHQLVHTKDGSYAACLLISYGTAKDRKAMIKSIKDVITQMSTDQYGHMVLIVICAVVDDTKLVTKSVLAELKPLWSDLFRNKFGRKLVLFLCREDKNSLVKECREKSANTRYLPGAEMMTDV
jgi:pumilio family protein 6